MNFFKKLLGYGSRNKSQQAPTQDNQALRADWIIIGLGNPGAKYATTRHNIGYFAVDSLLDKHQAKLQPVAGLQAQAAHIRIADQDVALVRSTTYMNESGQAVQPLAQQLDVPAHRVIVMHDELDIPPGDIRIKDKGGEGGHNGLRSITDQLGTQEYVRIRMGIGRPPKDTTVIDYVLSPFDQAHWLDDAVALAAEAAALTVEHGPDIARNDIHTRGK